MSGRVLVRGLRTMRRVWVMGIASALLGACGQESGAPGDAGATRDGSLLQARDASSQDGSFHDGPLHDGSLYDAGHDAELPRPSSCIGTWTGERCVLLLASGQSSPASIAVDDTDVYWLNAGTEPVRYIDGTVMKTSKNGGEIVTLATGQAFPGSIALDETSVYWSVYDPTNVAALVKMPKAGGTPTTIVSGQLDVAGVVVSAGSAYFTDNGVMKVPVDGGAPATLTGTDYNLHGLAANDAGVFFTDELVGAVLRVGLDGGATTTLASDAGLLSDIAVDAVHAYWLTVVGDAGAIVRAPLLGGRGRGPSVTLATTSGSPFALAVGTEGIYWQNGGAPTGVALMKVPKDGGPVTTLATGLAQSWPLGWVSGVGLTAADDTSVYAISGDEVLKVTPN